MTTTPRESETPLEDGDYCATDDALWVRVRNVAIRICGSDNGVSIDVCPDGDEADSTIDSMFVPFPEAE